MEWKIYEKGEIEKTKEGVCLAKFKIIFGSHLS